MARKSLVIVALRRTGIILPDGIAAKIQSKLRNILLDVNLTVPFKIDADGRMNCWPARPKEKKSPPLIANLLVFIAPA
jgi:hypothetical protein